MPARRRTAEQAADTDDGCAGAPTNRALQTELSSRAAAEGRGVPQLQLVERPPRERAALQDVVLRLVVVRPRVWSPSSTFLERDDVLVLRLDQQPRLRLVDRRGREGIDVTLPSDEQEDRDRRPAALVEHLHVVEQVRLDVADRDRAGPRRWSPAGVRRRRCRVRLAALVRCRSSRVERILGHQKNLSGTTMVSPGCTMSVSLAFNSFFSPSTMRMILMRVVAAAVGDAAGERQRLQHGRALLLQV